MKLFIKKNLHTKNLSIFYLVFFTLISCYGNQVFSSQENYFEELEINNTSKDGYESFRAIPTNPFEMVDMIRKANSMNDATNPSDAIDDAINSFNNLKLKDN